MKVFQAIKEVVPHRLRTTAVRGTEPTEQMDVLKDFVKTAYFEIITTAESHPETENCVVARSLRLSGSTV